MGRPVTKPPSNMRRVNPIIDKLDSKDQEMAEKLRRCGMRMILKTGGDIVFEPIDGQMIIPEQSSNSGNVIEGAFKDGET